MDTTGSLLLPSRIYPFQNHAKLSAFASSIHEHCLESILHICSGLKEVVSWILSLSVVAPDREPPETTDLARGRNILRGAILERTSGCKPNSRAVGEPKTPTEVGEHIPGSLVDPFKSYNTRRWPVDRERKHL